jgi:DNA-binding NarL/FixJ family response regulator
MGETVLIVDDHPTFRRFARQLLEEGNFAVVGEAADAEGAIEAVKKLRPEVVLLDVLLPDRSGLEVARELDAGPHRPAVVLTSSRQASDLGPALETAPCRGFIPKEGLSAAALAALVAV